MKLRALSLAVAAVALAASPSFAQSYPELKMRQGNVIPAKAGLSQASIFFAKEVSKRSGGKITVQNFWSGAAGGAREMLKLVSGGALDMGAFPGSWFPAQMQFLASVSALPTVIPDAPTAQKIVYTLWEKVPAFQKEAQANNIHPLFFQVLNEYRLLCNKPLRTIADFKGVKIRSQGEYFPLAVRALGAVPVTVLPGEFYEAMKRGTIDCMLLPWDLIAINRLHEVAKYGSDLSFGSIVANGVFVNAKKWNALSPAVKALMTEVAEEARAYDLKIAAEVEAKAVARMKSQGMQMIEFEEKAAFKAKMPDFLAEWQKRMTERGKGDGAAKTVAAWKSVK